MGNKESSYIVNPIPKYLQNQEIEEETWAMVIFTQKSLPTGHLVRKILRLTLKKQISHILIAQIGQFKYPRVQG